MLDQQTIDKVSQSLATTARGKFAEGLGNYTNGADQLGLNPIGDDSYCALAVGVHEDLPDVVVKVVSKQSDGFYIYAKAILDGTLSGEHYPVILSVTDVDEAVAVVLVERLLPCVFFEDEVRMAELKIFAQGVKGVTEMSDWVERNDLCTDMHAGNFMRRYAADGSYVVVMIDPVGPIHGVDDVYTGSEED